MSAPGRDGFAHNAGGQSRSGGVDGGRVESLHPIIAKKMAMPNDRQRQRRPSSSIAVSRRERYGW
jgi:hypothetical protein